MNKSDNYCLPENYIRLCFLKNKEKKTKQSLKTLFIFLVISLASRTNCFQCTSGPPCDKLFDSTSKATTSARSEKNISVFNLVNLNSFELTLMLGLFK